MPSMDIFSNSAFNTISLTGTVNKIDYAPQLLGSLNVFERMPVRNRTVFVDRQDGALRLIPSSPIGGPPEELVRDTRDAVPLKTTRLAKGFTIYAEEVQGVRALGSETEVMTMQAEALRRDARVRQDMELTHQYHRLGALQGKLLDADGTTVLYNYFTQFGVTEAAAYDFEMDDPATNIRGKCSAIKRDMQRASRGALTMTTAIHALAGDAFYDALVNHAKVERTYLNYAAAADLREAKMFDSFTFGGITWHNYRGTDDNTTVAVPSNEAKFFPVGAPDVFKVAMAPAEFEPWVNTLGQETYELSFPDRDRRAWQRFEQYSYPLYFCQRPEVLRKAVAY